MWGEFQDVWLGRGRGLGEHPGVVGCNKGYIGGRLERVGNPCMGWGGAVTTSLGCVPLTRFLSCCVRLPLESKWESKSTATKSL